MQNDGSVPFAPSTTLLNRTYVGLLVAQFLAAFNDQAIHAAAMFFAINTQTLTEPQAISLMPILFYAPWAIFCTLSGYLADRFSKRSTLVFWKVAEVAITAVALFGFWLGSSGGQPQVGAWIVLSTVFLMGTHSAFFVPAKYGVMPEILHPQLLSRGNGLLESLSFLAVILGTVSGGVMSFLFYRNETNIGIVLLVLAIVGAIGSLVIRRMPAANPTLAFPKRVYGPLWKNIRTLLTSRPLSFAVTGIAFFTFIVAFMRATVYMLGESRVPRWDELKTSAVVGTVALGVGLGSPLAGWFSGKKIELGLIPFGAAGMVIGCVCAALSLDHVPSLIACTILIGICTGFYLVPLFTLLQYRAAKTSKGDMIATSNFINVVGAIAASLLFAVLVWSARVGGVVPAVPLTDNVAQGVLHEVDLQLGRPVRIRIDDREFGRKPDDKPFHLVDHLFTETTGDVPPTIELRRGLKPGDSVIMGYHEVNGVRHYDVRPASETPHAHYDSRRLPRLLFFGAAVMTFLMFVLLGLRVRDLSHRAAGLLQSLYRPRYHLENLSRVPGDGRTAIIVDATDPWLIRTIRSAVDRHVVDCRHFAPDDARRWAELTWQKGDAVLLTSTQSATADWIDSADLVRAVVNGRTVAFE